MANSKDTLLLRLAVRQGIFSQEEAQNLLAYYRENAGVGEGIAKFLVREGYLDNESAGALNNAIAQRAEGHVVENRKRVPSLNKTDGARSAQPGARHGHVRARPNRTQANNGQIVLISLGGIISMVALVYLALQFNTPETLQETMEKNSAKEELAQKEAIAKRTKSSAIAANPVKISYTHEEIQSAVKFVKGVIGNARIESERPFLGLQQLERCLRNQELAKSPPKALKLLRDEIKTTKELMELSFKDLMVKLKMDSADTAALFDEIEHTLGKKYLDRAKGN